MIFMKAHVGVDSRSKLIHAVGATAANVHDAACLPGLLRGEVITERAPGAQDMTNRRCRRRGGVGEAERAKHKTKSDARVKSEHPFLVIERIFGFSKTRCRGLDEKPHRLFVTCSLTNLYLMRRRLLRLT